MPRLLLAASALCIVAAPAPSQEAPAPLGPNARSQFVERFLPSGFHRAFATAPDGRFGWAAHRPTIEEAIGDAIAACARDRGEGCRVRVVNGIAVDGTDPAALPRRDPAAPSLGPLVPGDYVTIRGAAVAPGLVIWSHGYRPGTDSSGTLAHAYVSRFAAAGWDVYRYNRVAIESGAADLAGLLAGIAAARDSGYRRVVLAGQSRGGWISLQAAAAGAAIDGVIATAPATHGNRADSPAMGRARGDFRALLQRVAARPERLPIAITLFEADSFDPGGRSDDVAALLGSREGVLFIDHPPGLRGHAAGASPGFNLRYGACLFVFVAEARRDPSCPTSGPAAR
ncbi:MAG: hypothetical protein JNK67_32240 [Alphaproteobacteria bacterium]|nr:hypothetical protein [Alphaproteobacteria bacterium]